MNRKELRQSAGCFVVLFGIMFILSSIGVIVTLVTGGSLSTFFSEDGESTFWWYKIQFWVLIISIVVLLFAGGKLSNLRLLNKFPYEEDNDHDSDVDKKPK